MQKTKLLYVIAYKLLLCGELSLFFATRSQPQLKTATKCSFLIHQTDTKHFYNRVVTLSLFSTIVKRRCEENEIKK